MTRESLAELNALVPIGQEAGLFKTILHAPWANVAKEPEDVAPLGEATLEVRTALKELP